MTPSLEEPAVSDTGATGFKRVSFEWHTIGEPR